MKPPSMPIANNRPRCFMLIPCPLEDILTGTKQIMSWQDYIDGSLVASGNVAYGAILGLDGSVWARSDQLYRITLDEIKALVNAFTDDGLNNLRSNGCFLAGEKYMVIRGDHRSIYIKRGQGGAAAVQTSKCVVLGVYTDGMVVGQCNSAVERLADYLIESGF